MQLVRLQMNFSNFTIRRVLKQLFIAKRFYDKRYDIFLLSFQVRWNHYLVSQFSPVYCYGIITHRRIQNPANTKKKIRNPLKISAVNMTKSAVFRGFGLHLQKKSLMKNVFFCEVLNIQDGGGFSVNKKGCWVLNTSESLSETQSLSVSISLRLNLSESFRYSLKIN